MCCVYVLSNKHYRNKFSTDLSRTCKIVSALVNIGFFVVIL
jgi:hypothetical protein